MSNSFRDFFPDKLAAIVEQEKRISTRLPAFRAKAIDEAQAAAIRKAKTQAQKINGNTVFQLDADANMLALSVACITYPDLQDAALQEAWGVRGAEDLLKKMLLPGEYLLLSDWIAELCGFDIQMEDLVDQAKK